MNERKNDIPEVASLSIIMVLGKWIRVLGIVAATAFVAALLFSSTWFIKPEYYVSSLHKWNFKGITE
ncbi:MAG TPA: hypothetical protein PKE52_03685 [Bacteroidales bacterium]|nr:hypothetical protein [Bacteroidales bacterium]